MEIENLKLQVAEKVRQIKMTFGEASRASAPKVESNVEQKSTCPLGSKRLIRTVVSPTKHVLLIYLKDKKEGSRSGEKRVTEAINPAELKIEVIG